MTTAPNRLSQGESRWPGGSLPRNGTGGDRLGRAVKERRLVARYRERGDRAARDAMVERFLPLATALARRYHRGGEPLDDLVQVASVGLLKAIDRFDPARGTAFSSFAVPTIAGELKRHYRDKGWAVRVSRDLQEMAVGLFDFFSGTPSKDKFVSINDIRLSRDCVKKSIKYLREIYRHRIGKTKVISLNNHTGKTA